MTLGLVVIATGPYVQFVEPLLDSAKCYLQVSVPYSVLLFSDCTQGDLGHEVLWIPHEPWPGPTLHRYRHMLAHESALRRCDHLLYIDADMRFAGPVGDEVLGSLVATIHPGFVDVPSNRWPLETRAMSSACVETISTANYYCGGLQGGRSEVYLKAVRSLAAAVEEDERRGVTACWHDESHWNRYLNTHPPDRILTPLYCRPEEFGPTDDTRIIALSKDHQALRNDQASRRSFSIHRGPQPMPGHAGRAVAGLPTPFAAPQKKAAPAKSALGSRVFIGVFSGWNYAERRTHCRDTWMAEARGKGIDTAFMIGAGNDVERPLRFDDIVFLPCPDDYASLPQRTRWFCRWALERNDWDYLFKCDDDTFVSISRIATYDCGGKDYIGGEWKNGVGYASGGAGYLLSRRAAAIVAERLTDSTGDEDVLVGQVLRKAAVPFEIDSAFVGIGSRSVRPRRDNAIITGHGISTDLRVQSHRELSSQYGFRVVMPTCDRYADTVAPITLDLLGRYWPEHPPIDILHCDVSPPRHAGATRLYMGSEQSLTWTGMLKHYLEQYNRDALVLLLLDDYGLCQAVRCDVITQVEQAMHKDPRVACVHLTWQPIVPKTARGPLLELPRWAYSVNTQAALWRRDSLLELATECVRCSIEDFELEGSDWFNANVYPQRIQCQAAMSEPRIQSSFVDETDKSCWIVAYNNLMRRGSPDPRHSRFLSRHGYAISAPCQVRHVGNNTRIRPPIRSTGRSHV